MGVAAAVGRVPAGTAAPYYGWSVERLACGRLVQRPRHIPAVIEIVASGQVITPFHGDAAVFTPVYCWLKSEGWASVPTEARTTWLTKRLSAHPAAPADEHIASAGEDRAAATSGALISAFQHIVQEPGARFLWYFAAHPHRIRAGLAALAADLAHFHRLKQR